MGESRFFTIVCRMSHEAGGQEKFTYNIRELPKNARGKIENHHSYPSP